MNGVSMNFDYSKTINEQLPTFNYYKDRYCSYELELFNDRKEIERLNNIIEYKKKDIRKLKYELNYEKAMNKRLNNIINELEKKIISICETCYENRETARIAKWIKELKGDGSSG